MLEVWRGGVNAWDCDVFGHMNMRFYFGRAAEGMAELAAAMGHPRAFTADASATLAIARQHVRFLDEARAGAPLYMTAGVLEIAADEAQVVQVLHHAEDDRPCAAITTRVIHATPDGRVFPWPDRARRAAEALKISAPAYAVSRGVPTGPRVDGAGAWDPALACISRGPVLPKDCDAFGEMSMEAGAGRISDGMGLLYPPIGRAIAAATGLRIGAAAVEYRIDHFARPRPGDMVEVRSRVTSAEGKAIRLEHWLCDSRRRQVWAHALAVTVHFDLDGRRAVEAPPEVLSALGLARSALQP